MKTRSKIILSYEISNQLKPCKTKLGEKRVGCSRYVTSLVQNVRNSIIKTFNSFSSGFSSIISLLRAKKMVQIQITAPENMAC